MSKMMLATAVSVAALLASSEFLVAQDQQPPAEESAASETSPAATGTDAQAESPVASEQKPAPAAAEGDEATAEAPPPEEGTPVEGQIFAQSPDSFLASTLMDASVVTVDGETVGDVDDLVLSADGSVEGVVIGVGGFLGIGKKNVALKFATIEINQDENEDLTFALTASKDELEEAPAFRTQADIKREAEAQAALEAARQQTVGGVTPPPLPGEDTTSPPSQ